MDVLLQILAFATTVLVLVSVHEAGHFLVARWLGIKVLRFSIGFGKPIWRRTAKSGVEYVIGFLPLGGYVKMLDEREEHVPENLKHLAFNRQPLWARFLVVLAGPLTNILFALVAFWLMFSVGYESVRPVIAKVVENTVAADAGILPNTEITAFNGTNVEDWQDVVLGLVKRMGETGTIQIKTKDNNDIETTHVANISNWKVDDLNPEPLRSFGLIPVRPPVESIITEIEKNSPADKAGLQVGDEITAVDNKEVKDFHELSRFLQHNPNKAISLSVKRQGEMVNIPITIGSKFVLSGFRHVGFIGIRVEVGEYPEDLKFDVDYSFFGAMIPAWNKTWEFFGFNFIVIKKMIKREISLRSLGGPITIFQVADRAFKEGFVVFLSFLALVSVMLAFINVLPIPGLDGGHLLFFLIEAIIRRPLSVAFEVLALRLGMIFLLFVMLAVTMNDLLRLIM